MTDQKLSKGYDLYYTIKGLKSDKEKYEYFLKLIIKDDCDNWRHELIGFGSSITLSKEYIPNKTIVLMLENALVEIRTKLLAAEKEFEKL